MFETPFIINHDATSLFGIIRTTEYADKIVILLPALTGTRVGPQRIYVEIARELLKMNIASLCVDLPPNGDSYDNCPEFNGSNKEILIQYYKRYLDLLLAEVREKYSFKTIILLSISIGCMPILSYATKNNLRHAILLSPYNLEVTNNRINRKNLKSYYLKLSNIHTWLKLLKLDLDFKSIFRNIFGVWKFNKPIESSEQTSHIALSKNTVNILTVFGEKDHELVRCQLFWDNYVKNDHQIQYKQTIIKGADHSFFGWGFKRQVCKEITEWLDKILLEDGHCFKSK